MAEFCASCWPRVFGDPADIHLKPGFNDLEGVAAPGSTVAAICEGCGPGQFDHRGVRVCPLCGVKGTCMTCRIEAVEASMEVTKRYFVTLGEEREREVTMAEWVAVERRAGFHNTLGRPDRPGTAGFSTTAQGGISGRIEYG